MQEVKVMMISSSENPITINEFIPQEPITTTTCPTWKLYDNPSYNQPQPHHHKHNLHQLHLPLSARKIAASFWDLTFFRPIMETELDLARAQIIELQAELQYERKARKRGETMNRRLAKELAEERRGRDALERVCEDLAREISSDQVEIDRMKREIEEERKMLRMAEVLREERVQMKLAEAKFQLEEKLSELEGNKLQAQLHESLTLKKMEGEQKNINEEDKTPKIAADLRGKFSRLILGEKCCEDTDSRESPAAILSRKSLSSSWNDNASVSSSLSIQRRASPEPENPHIKRGIKGFVEFPRMVRAMGSKSRQWGTKLECQKAQLRILLRHRSPIRSNNLIIS